MNSALKLMGTIVLGLTAFWFLYWTLAYFSVTAATAPTPTPVPTYSYSPPAAVQQYRVDVRWSQEQFDAEETCQPEGQKAEQALGPEPQSNPAWQKWATDRQNAYMEAIDDCLIRKGYKPRKWGF